MILGYLLSAFPHRQFHTLPGLLDSWAALPNSYPNACMPIQGGSLYHFYDSVWYDPAERRTDDLPFERRTRYRLSQPAIYSHCSNYGTSARRPSLFSGNSDRARSRERLLFEYPLYKFIFLIMARAARPLSVWTGLKSLRYFHHLGPLGLNFLI